jgi:putative flippase GtrA
LKFLIGHEIKNFIIVMLISILLDFLVYRLLLWFDVFALHPTINIDLCKMLGFLVGTFFLYIGNKFWTFGDHPHAKGTFFRFIIIYLITILANVLINSLTLKSVTFIAFIGAQDIARVLFAFILASLVSTLIGFFGMKFYVFKGIKKEPQKEALSSR